MVPNPTPESLLEVLVLFLLFCSHLWETFLALSPGRLLLSPIAWHFLLTQKFLSVNEWLTSLVLPTETSCAVSYHCGASLAACNGLCEFAPTTFLLWTSVSSWTERALDQSLTFFLQTMGFSRILSTATSSSLPIFIHIIFSSSRALPLPPHPRTHLKCHFCHGVP